MPSLQELLLSPMTTLHDVRSTLDGMDHAERMAALAQTNRKSQRRMYELADKVQPLSLEHIVPPARSPGVEVRHHGRNTLPLPGSLRFFEKRFCRPRDGSARLFGYNEGGSRPLIGPGYFVAYSTDDKPEWKARGDVVVDYYQVPDGDVVSGWPAVVPNSKGLQMFVFKGTRDFMRKVSEHVAIGAAYKGEKALDHYFTLCRQD